MLDFITTGPLLLLRAILGQTLHFELLGYLEEVVEVLLGDVDLAMVHKGDDGLKVSVGDALEIQERVSVGILLEDCSEERGAGGQDQFVCLDLLRATTEGAVKQVLKIIQ